MISFPEKSILPPPQQILWPELAVATQHGFVLYGGTAIALHLGHRQSIDFDFFTEQPFDPDTLYLRLPFFSGAEILQSEPNTLTALVRRGVREDETVKVSLFGALNFGRIGAPTTTPDGVLVVASKADLLGHKLKVLLQRIEAKDFLDIEALLSDGVALEEGLAAAQGLFPTFPPAQALKALTYFAPKELDGLDVDIKKRLVAAARSILNIPPPAPVLSLQLG